MNLLEALETFAQSVPAFLTTSVVSIEDGTSLSTVMGEIDVDGAAADAYFTEVLKKNAGALMALGIQSETEDILISTPSACFLIRTLPNTPYFWNVATRQDGSLGLTRALMRKHEANVLQGLPL